MIGHDRGAHGAGEGGALEATDASEDVLNSGHVLNIKVKASYAGVEGDGRDVYTDGADCEKPVGAERGEEDQVFL